MYLESKFLLQKIGFEFFKT